MRASNLITRFLMILSAIKARLWDPLYRLFRTVFPKAWLLKGLEKGSDQPVVVLLFGETSPFDYLALMIFEGQPVRQSLGRCAFWQWKHLVQHHQVDLFFAESTMTLAQWLAKRQGYCLPEHLDALAPTDPQDFSRSSGKICLTAQKNISQKGWTYRTSRREVDFIEFYHNLYLPSAMRKFEGYRYVMPFSDMSALFRIGVLLQVWEGDRVIAAILAAERHQHLWLGFYGGMHETPDGPYEGLQSASYYFSLQYGRERGYSEVNFANARPFFRDGVYQHKRHWNTRFEYSPLSGRCYWFVPNLQSNAARRFLNQNPFITKTSQGLEAICFYDPATIDRAAWAAHCRKHYLAKGIPGARFIPTGSIERPVSREDVFPVRSAAIRPAATIALNRLLHPLYAQRNRADHPQFYRETPWMSSAQLQKLREEKWTRLLKQARQTVPHFQSLSGDVSLQQLPLMDRQDMALHPDRYRSFPHPKIEARVCTSGTTSHPVTLWVDRASIVKREAVRWRGRQWWGIQRGERFTKYWGRLTQPSWRQRFISRYLDNAVLFNSYRITTEESEHCYKSLLESTYYYGYASVTFEIAQDWKKRGWLVPPGWLKAAIVTADMITDEQKKVIEQVFGTAVVREYGSTEFHEIAMECPEGGWHLDVDRLWIEFINEEGKACKPFEPGQIVITDLDNLSMPLIRYPIGDIGAFSNKPCTCGRSFPLLAKLLGRQNAFLRLPSGGRAHSGVFSSLIDDIFLESHLPATPWQARQTALDHVHFQFTHLSRSTLLEREIQKHIAALDPQLKTSVQYVESIPWTPNGKRSHFIGLEDAPSKPALKIIESNCYNKQH